MSAEFIGAPCGTRDCNESCENWFICYPNAPCAVTIVVRHEPISCTRKNGHGGNHHASGPGRDHEWGQHPDEYRHPGTRGGDSVSMAECPMCQGEGVIYP